MKDTSYTSHTLDNGLTVLLQENHSVPLVCHWIWYRVGPRVEVPGKTGISHFVEHMQFKGSKRFPGNQAPWEIYRNGGILNAITSLDWTSFYEIMPANRIGIALDIEADRMVNSIFNPEEIESERTVIFSEMAGQDSDSMYRLTETLRKACFPHHPYGVNTLGEAEDLLRLTQDDLYEHYRTWYIPNNAVVTLAGDFDTEEMIHRIEDAYGNIPARPVPAICNVPEEPLRSSPVITIPDYCIFGDLRMFWRIPAADHPDIPAMLLLNCILAGPDSLCMFESTCLPYAGISIPNRTSRLFRALVDNWMTAGISFEYNPSAEPYFLALSAPLCFGETPEKVSEAIFRELENIARQGVLPAEIEKARKQAKAVFAYAAENIVWKPYWLGQSSMIAGPEWYTGLLQRLESVNTADISRVAGTIFSRDNCVIGAIIPKEEQQ